VSSLLLATGCGTAADESAGPSGTFSVTFLGFTANHETFDHQLDDDDGRGDEVFLVAVTSRLTRDREVVDDAMSPPALVSRTLGDTARHPERARCGSKSATGGIDGGDSCPGVRPWEADVSRVQGPACPEGTCGPPMVIARFLLQRGGGRVLVSPSLWEWDGGEKARGGLHRVSSYSAVQGLVDGRLGVVTDENGAEDGFEFWQPHDRPIGGVLAPARSGAGEPRERYHRQALYLDYDTARSIARTDSGKGPGVVEIRLAERGSGWLVGDYTLFLKVAAS
jgi:hypothetical protein